MAERFSVVRIRVAQLAPVDRVPAAVWMHNGWPLVVFGFTIEGGKITSIEHAADKARVGRINIELLA